MNPLQSELHRLYFPRSPAQAGLDEDAGALISPSGAVRALVIELRRPASWAVLSRVWQGVQAQLDLPAPAIAVSGVDALSLWFSLAEPLPVSRAHAFLEGLRARFLADVPGDRVRLLPAADASASRRDRHAALVPARQEQTGNWSAFVSQDLASIFADTPWLDIPPSEYGQAALLHGLKTTSPDLFEVAAQRLGPSIRASQPAAPVARVVDVLHIETGSAAAEAIDDPKRFLLRVMNDSAVSMALRIDAAKALLQHSVAARDEAAG